LLDYRISVLKWKSRTSQQSWCEASLTPISRQIKYQQANEGLFVEQKSTPYIFNQRPAEQGFLLKEKNSKIISNLILITKPQG